MEDAETVEEVRYAAMSPIITETGFIIPASARPIIEALARKSGSLHFYPRTTKSHDAIAKSGTGFSQEGPGADVETAKDQAPTDVCFAHHASPSPYNCMPFSSGIKANHYTRDIQSVQVANLSTPPWRAQTAWMAVHEIADGPSRWASASFIGIRDRARLMITNTATAEYIIGPTSLHKLFDGRVRNPDLQWNVSDWAQDFMSNFPHMSLPDKVACWAILWKVLRWQTVQTRGTYEEVPSWCRPSNSELFCPHMPIIICLAWPVLRRYFVENASNADWTEAVMGSISVSWPYGDHTVFRAEASGALTISHAFEAWINDSSNWSLNTNSARAMIGIEGRVPLR